MRNGPRHRDVNDWNCHETLKEPPTHHPAILSIPRAPVITAKGFAIDLVGARTRVEFFERMVESGAPGQSSLVTPPLPSIGPPENSSPRDQ